MKTLDLHIEKVKVCILQVTLDGSRRGCTTVWFKTGAADCTDSHHKNSQQTDVHHILVYCSQHGKKHQKSTYQGNELWSLLCTTWDQTSHMCKRKLDQWILLFYYKNHLIISVKFSSTENQKKPTVLNTRPGLVVVLLVAKLGKQLTSCSTWAAQDNGRSRGRRER